MRLHYCSHLFIDHSKRKLVKTCTAILIILVFFYKPTVKKWPRNCNVVLTDEVTKKTILQNYSDQFKQFLAKQLEFLKSVIETRGFYLGLIRNRSFELSNTNIC